MSNASGTRSLAETSPRTTIDLDSGTSEESLVAPEEFINLELLDDLNPLEWRIEVTNTGQNWNWRKGSGKNRTGRYGGVFKQLSDERKAAYEHNRKLHHQRRRKKTNEEATTTTAQQSGRTLNPENSTDRVSTSGSDRSPRAKQSGLTPAA